MFFLKGQALCLEDKRWFRFTISFNYVHCFSNGPLPYPQYAYLGYFYKFGPFLNRETFELELIILLVELHEPYRILFIRGNVLKQTYEKAVLKYIASKFCVDRDLISKSK